MDRDSDRLPHGTELDELYSQKLSLPRHDEFERPSSRSLTSIIHAKGTEQLPSQWRRLSPSPTPSGRLSPIPIEPFELQERLYVEPEPSPAASFWQKNKPAILVALSQMFGALMNMSARLLELEGDGMHPLQVLLVRQMFTCVACSAYMWWAGTPGFPLGPKGVRGLLGLRGISGFFGIFGMWMSMMYLPLADATVITFLAPGVAGFLCYFLLREPFTRAEQLATLVALFGVVLIAQPASLFSRTDGGDQGSADASKGDTTLPGIDHEATPEERLAAVGMALVGVCGAAGAFTTLRTIGKRAHPLISVNIFGFTCVVVCVTALIICPWFNIAQPAVRWVTPQTAKQWILFCVLGIVGFVMQYLLTSGLAADRTNRANAMVYTHMLFAAGIDRWVFHHEMGLMSFGGCTLILGSAISIVVMKSTAAPKGDDLERQQNLVGEAEGSPMLVGRPSLGEVPRERVS